MAEFTDWVLQVREGTAGPMDKAALARLVAHVHHHMTPLFARRFPYGQAFGQTPADDLVQEMVLWLLEVEAAQRPLPEKIIDTDSLRRYLYRKACKRSYDRHQTASGKAGGPSRRGFSGYAGTAKEVSPQTFAEVPDDQRRSGPSFDSSDAQFVMTDGFDAAVADLQVLSDGDEMSIQILDLVVKGLSVRQIASEVNLHESAVYRHRRLARYCIMRRAEFSRTFLVMNFSAAEVDESERCLRDAGRGLAE